MKARKKLKVNFDGELSIATGTTANAKIWQNEKWKWSDLVKKIRKKYYTNETLQHFLSLPKQQQDKIKDVGGYVGGYLLKGSRTSNSIKYRQLITLDVDFAKPDFWKKFTKQFSCAAIVHGTHKYSKERPRLRLIIPIDRQVTCDEYSAISRKIAERINIDYFDSTTFQVNRLMFWPSTPIDIQYYCKFQDGVWLRADTILNEYEDWRDTTQWASSDVEIAKLTKDVKKQKNPLDKKNLIGVFCRTYSIHEAICKYLPDVYLATDDNRYTYVNGTTSNGLVVYEDLFAYSHHSTDPICGKLCNAFDLVRMHKFGHLDADDITGKASQRAMEDLIFKDKNVKINIADEREKSIQEDFAVELNEEDTERWESHLDIDGRGMYISSAKNISLILAKDEKIKGRFRFNTFDNKRYVYDSVPWRNVDKPEPVKDVDYAGIRSYLEKKYGITGITKIDDGIALEFNKRAFNPIKNYLESIKWDGVKRLDTLLIDYFGAADNIYTREAIRKTLVGAIARIYNPGVKYDLVLTLVGGQGTGKSTLIRRLGLCKWYSDTFTTFNGKEAFEQLQGAWLIEMAELSSLRKSELETVKMFLTKCEDYYRPAYARTVEAFPRQCIFIGTTNDKTFLKDPTGNRRFMPVDVERGKSILWKSYFDIVVHDVWAEAVALYKNGETLYLSKDAERIANNEREEHFEIDERMGIVENYLNLKLPKNWETMDLMERKNYLADDSSIVAKGIVVRTRVCAAEIFCEALNQQPNDMTKYNMRDINNILRSLHDWMEVKSTNNFSIYGKQRYYTRIGENFGKISKKANRK